LLSTVKRLVPGLGLILLAAVVLLVADRAQQISRRERLVKKPLRLKKPTPVFAMLL
jgi:hypothetical protein